MRIGNLNDLVKDVSDDNLNDAKKGNFVIEDYIFFGIGIGNNRLEGNNIEDYPLLISN